MQELIWEEQAVLCPPPPAALPGCAATLPGLLVLAMLKKGSCEDK